MKLKILIAAGGTGGHLFPALAVLERLEKLTGERVEAHFVGNMKKIESRVAPELGYNFHPIPISGFYGIFSLKTYLLPFKIFASVMKCRSIIRKKKIDAVLCTGAYLSYPAGLAASAAKTPLILMESNVYPGKTIQMLAPKASLFITSFEETNRSLPKDILRRTVTLGNPVRNQMTDFLPKEKARVKFGLDPNKKTVFIFGGSLGAKSINRAVDNYLSESNNDDIQYIWQTGSNFTPQIEPGDKVKILTFVNDMGAAYSASDLIISRSGATTVAELCLMGKPSVLVPLATASNNEQASNAGVLQDKGASVLIHDADIGESLGQVIDDLINDEQKLIEMSEAAKSLAKPDAAADSANKILELLNWDFESEASTS